MVALSQPVTLATVKAEPRLAEMALVRKSRISVVPVTAAEFALVLRLGATKLPGAAKAKTRPRPAAKRKPAARAAGRRSLDAAQ